MDCLRFVELASAPHVPPEELMAYQSHRAACRECAAAETALKAVKESVAAPTPGSLVGFAPRVRARAARERLSRTLSPAWSAFGAGALAISAAVIVVVAFNQFPAPRSAPAEAVAQASQVDDDVETLVPTDDPFASLTDDELKAVEEIMDNDVSTGEEAGI